jgi:hypothetical protein
MAATAFALQAASEVGQRGLPKLMTSIFGEGDAARSTDVAIVNNTGSRLFLGAYNVETGMFKGCPPEIIEPDEVIVYRVESHGFMTGCTGCVIGYSLSAANRGNLSRCEYKWFTSNPYAGSNDAGSIGQRDVIVRKGGGNNNQVKIIIQR